MKSGTRLLLCLATLLSTCLAAFSGSLREDLLREAALNAGLIPAAETHAPVDEKLVGIGKRLFESTLLSLEGQTACASCHVDRFGSADGLPNAIGTEGQGIGHDRLARGGDIIPRNTLPFWGRGGKGFDVFFWDGKVDGSSGTIQSQFAGEEPSSDPLVVAVHLPPVEIGEMVLDSSENQVLETETVETAQRIYDTLADRIRLDAKLGPELAAALGIQIEQVQFGHIAEAIATFIRHNFRLKPTRFHRFVFEKGTLATDEIAGGLLFYGKGKCHLCHNGPYFSDLKFYAIPFPQAGFGKNGFGIDYGRFNVTLAFDDRYRFRTPPLYNVSKTAPYSHSGAVGNLTDAIRAHTDPLAIYDVKMMTSAQRADFYERLRFWASESVATAPFDKTEMEHLVAFLRTLNFESDLHVEEIN